MYSASAEPSRVESSGPVKWRMGAAGGRQAARRTRAESRFAATANLGWRCLSTIAARYRRRELLRRRDSLCNGESARTRPVVSPPTVAGPQLSRRRSATKCGGAGSQHRCRWMATTRQSWLNPLPIYPSSQPASQPATHSAGRCRRRERAAGLPTTSRPGPVIST